MDAAALLLNVQLLCLACSIILNFYKQSIIGLRQLILHRSSAYRCLHLLLKILSTRTVLRYCRISKFGMLRHISSFIVGKVVTLRQLIKKQTKNHFGWRNQTLALAIESADEFSQGTFRNCKLLAADLFDVGKLLIDAVEFGINDFGWIYETWFNFFKVFLEDGELFARIRSKQFHLGKERGTHGFEGDLLFFKADVQLFPWFLQLFAHCLKCFFQFACFFLHFLRNMLKLDINLVTNIIFELFKFSTKQFCRLWNFSMIA